MGGEHILIGCRSKNDRWPRCQRSHPPSDCLAASKTHQGDSGIVIIKSNRKMKLLLTYSDVNLPRIIRSVKDIPAAVVTSASAR